MKREVPVEEAVGLRLAHDMTRIVPGEFKGAAFRMGHVVTKEDIPLLLDMGKRHVYVLELGDDELHENEGAIRLAAAVAGKGLKGTQPEEGKVVLKSLHDGVVWVDEDKVLAINEIADIALAVRQPWTHVRQGAAVAGVRPIPLVIERDKIERAESIAAQPMAHPQGRQATGVIDVIAYRPQQVALVSTGSEIATGRIADRFGPALREKFALYKVGIGSQTFPGDDLPEIVGHIRQAIGNGATLVCVTGGMSVDADDRSPAAISTVADTVVSYGVPVLPGSMTMVAYHKNVAILGLPGAVMHDERTTLDLLLPRILAGVRLTKRDLAKLGTGGWLNA